MPSHAHEPLCAARAQRLATALRLSVRPVLAGLLVLPPGVTPAMPAPVQAAARLPPVAPPRGATTGLYSAPPRARERDVPGKRVVSRGVAGGGRSGR